jgi:hypothetical protein
MSGATFWRTAILAFALLASISHSAVAEVLYRETFGRPTGGNAALTLWDWAIFNAAGGNGGNAVNGADMGKPTDVANTASAGPNSDGTTIAQPLGWSFLDGTDRLVMTTEYSFNPSDYMNNLKFNWWQANGGMTVDGTTMGGFQVAVRQGGNWYVSSQVFNNSVNNTLGGPGVNANGEFREFLYNPAAANWLTLTMNGDYTLGATPGTGTFVASSAALAQGSAPMSDLTGPITAFGLWRNTAINNSRFDTYTIESAGPPPLPGDTDGDGIAGEFPDDFEPIRANFRESVTGRSMGDLTGDGLVNFADFREWKAVHLGGGGSLAGLDMSFGTSVPEPSSTALICIAVSAVFSNLISRSRRIGWGGATRGHS